MRDKVPLIIVLVLLLGGGFALMMLAGAASDRRLDKSLIGLIGLSAWLEESDVPVVRSKPRATPSVSDLSLRVFPLYDIDLEVKSIKPANARQLMRQRTQRDIDHEAYWEKLLQMPTVVLLPKWTTGFVETGIAHEKTLIPMSGFSRLFEQLDFGDLELVRDGPRFVTEQVGWDDRYDVALFHAQTFAAGSLPEGCRSYLGFGQGVLVMACSLEDADHPVFFVSDPDLMNNHGLANAENAAFAADFLAGLRPRDSRSIYMDTSPVILADYELADDERVDYERSGADLARYFEYPLSVLWAVMLFVLAVLFWRGAIRFGPLQRETGRSADQSRSVAIAAKARLLRLSNSDGQMVADFVRAQLMDLVTNMFGPDAGEAGQKRFFAHLSRRDATLGSTFQAACESLINRGPQMPHPELSKALETYRNLLERVNNANGSIGISKSR
jgi:hypothetical protein